MALLATLGVYYVVIRVVLAQPGTPVITDAAPMRTTFFLLSAGMVGTIVLVRRGVVPIQARQRQSAAFLRHIVSWALAESTGLYGMILAFQTRRAEEARLPAARPRAAPLAPPAARGFPTRRLNRKSSWL